MTDIRELIERRTDASLPARSWEIGSRAIAYAAKLGEGEPSVAHDNVMGCLASACHYLSGAEGKKPTAEFLRGLADDIEADHD